MTKKAVLVLGMGGTLGMRADTDGPLKPDHLLENIMTWIPELEDLAVMHNEILFDIDSSQVTPDHWLVAARRIKSAQLEGKYAGIVVLHGTDTLAYTASALSFLLPDLMIPVVLTGGQKPLAFLRTDARNNVLGAVESALEMPMPEVTVFFNNTVYRGNRVEKASIDAFDAFDSPNYPPLGRAGIKWSWSRELCWPKSQRPSIWSDIPASLPTPPWVVPWVPGMDFSLIACALENQWALILEAFGTGNMPFSEEVSNILKAYIQGGGLVFVRSQVRRGRMELDAYAPGKLLKEVGFSDAGDMTREAMVTKLMVLKALGLSGHELVSRMTQCLVGELTL